MTVRVAADVFKAVADHARQTLPYEACGLLGAGDGLVFLVMPLSNAEASPVGFRLDPAEQFDAARSFRQKGAVPWGVYHSHPSGSAEPSGRDIDLARDVPFFQAIVGLGGKTPVIRFFDPGYRRERHVETMP